MIKQHFISLSILISVIACLPASRQSQTISPPQPDNGILIVNTNGTIEKYAIIQREFEREFAHQTISTVDLAKDGVSAVSEKLASMNPYVVYVIGSKAYTQSAKLLKEQPLIFSSLINWRRLTTSNTNTYGIELEMPAEMQLFMYSYLFPEIKKLGVLYSDSHNRQWFELAVSKAKEVDISLYGKAIDNADANSSALQEMLPKIDALWLIPDPVVLYDADQVQQIFSQAAALKKPVFAYNTLFIQHGATLTISADIPTMGRQAAELAQELFDQETIIEDEKVQLPAGSHITLNLKKVREYGIKIDNTALSSVENIIK